LIDTRLPGLRRGDRFSYAYHPAGGVVPFLPLRIPVQSGRELAPADLAALIQWCVSADRSDLVPTIVGPPHEWPAVALVLVQGYLAARIPGALGTELPSFEAISPYAARVREPAYWLPLLRALDPRAVERDLPKMFEALRSRARYELGHEYAPGPDLDDPEEDMDCKVLALWSCLDEAFAPLARPSGP